MKAFRPRRMTAMYRAQMALGATFSEEGEWTVAEVYTDPLGEARCARAGVGLSDVSACGKLAVRGEALDALVAKVGGLGLPEAGAAARARIDGADALVVRLAPDELLVLTRAGGAPAVGALLATASESVGCAHVTDLTSALVAVDLLGPRARALLAKLVPLDLSPAAVPALGLVQGELARVRTIMVRLDCRRLPVFRILAPREYGEFVWGALIDAGRDLDLVPVGAVAHALVMAEA